MSSLFDSLRIDFSETQAREPFVLSLGDDQGSMPLRVYPLIVNSWSQKPGIYDALLDRALRMKVAGVRRIRLYCPAHSALESRLFVHGGQHHYLGRRQEPLVETLSWNQEESHRLRFFYDQPTVRILEKTLFFDDDGEETSPPEYTPSQGTFRHVQKVTGSMVVEYYPGFSLYEIEYDTGEEQMTEKAFREVKRAWLAGNIRDAVIPAVRVMALNGKSATQLSFQRAFWPEHSSVRSWFQEEVSEPEMVPVPGGFRFDPADAVDSCWSRCKEKIKPGGYYLTTQERQAILTCVEAGNAPLYHYVERKRVVKTERIHSQNDPSVYVDVERPVELVFQFQRADDSPCVDRSPPNCCPELVFRFKSS